MRRNTLFVVVLVGSSAVCLAQDTARMDQVVESFVSSGTFGGSVLVARGTDVVFSKGYGPANADWNIPNGPTTRFRVASITKQFTAAAILLLEERGKLKLDDPVKKHLPAAPVSWDRMTIFHLLSHTAGFAGLGTPPDQRGPAVESADGSVAGFVTRLTERPLLSPPGETFSYTNSGYFILGHLIQTISGQSYERFITDNIFTPLGMKDTGLDSSGIVERRAGFYAPSRNGLINTPVTAIRVDPNTAAGFYSTTEDLLRWQVGLYGGKVVSPASLQKMMTASKGDYGLGLYVRTVAGRKAMQHGGGAPAFASLTYFPDSRTSVAVLGNLNVAPAHEIAGFLAALAHGGTVQLPSERKAITLGPDVLARYAGTYVQAGRPMVFALEGSQLVFLPSGGQKLPLLAESETSFFLRDVNVRMEFVQDGAGRVTELIIHQGGVAARAVRQP